MKKKELCTLENEYVKFWIEDGVLMESLKVRFIDLTIAKRIVEDRKRFSAGSTMPMLVEFFEYVQVSKEARRYFALKDSSSGLSALAIVTNNPVILMGCKLYALLEKPDLKTEVFISKQKALNWFTELQLLDAVPGRP